MAWKGVWRTSIASMECADLNIKIHYTGIFCHFLMLLPKCMLYDTAAPLTCNVTNTRVHTQRHTRVHALAPNCGFQNGRLPGIHHQLQTEFWPCK